MEALQAWDVCFSELVRQVFVQCNDRGELLGRVRRAHQHGRWLTTVDNRSASAPTVAPSRPLRVEGTSTPPQQLGEPANVYRLKTAGSPSCWRALNCLRPQGVPAHPPHAHHPNSRARRASIPLHLHRHYLTQLVQQVQRLELSDRESELRQVCTLLYYYFFLCNPLAARYSLSLRHSLSVPLAARRGGGAARASRRVDAGGAQEQTRGDAAQRCSRVPY